MPYPDWHLASGQNLFCKTSFLKEMAIELLLLIVSMRDVRVIASPRGAMQLNIKKLGLPIVLLKLPIIVLSLQRKTRGLNCRNAIYRVSATLKTLNLRVDTPWTPCI